MRLGDILDEKTPFLILIPLILFGSIAASYVEDQAITNAGIQRFEFDQQLIEARLKAAEFEWRSEGIEPAELDMVIEPIVLDIQGVDVAIYEGSSIDQTALLFASAENKSAYRERPASRSLQTDRQIQLFGQPATIRYSTNAQFVGAGEKYRPVLLLLGGIVLAILASAAFIVVWRSQQRAELISTERQLSLAKSQARMKSIFDHAGDGICGLNKAGQLIFANRAASAIFGIPVKQLLGRSFGAVANIAETSLGIGTESEQSNPVSKGRSSFPTANGQTKTIDYTAAPMTDHTGGTAGTVVTIRDVTEKIATEGDLRAANAELEEFAYRTSHDLRSPLISSVALLKIAHEQIDQGNVPVASKSLAMSIGALASLERLIDDILELSRTRNVDEANQPMNIEALVDNAIEKTRHLDGAHRLSFNLDMKADAPVVSKESRVRLIVDNLISNAVKYHDPAHQQPCVWVSTYVTVKAVVLMIEDNGLGIPEDQQENLFGMFKRFHPKVSFGSGLGLYMIKKSADIVGASVTYQPSERGTGFRVEFPLRPNLAQAA